MTRRLGPARATLASTSTVRGWESLPARLG
jgi:hypothetical protein